MKCFFHNDLDGACSGFWVYNDVPTISQCEMIEMNYNKPFPFDIIKPGEDIWIVDYHIKPDEMEKLLDITLNVIWIDHHITAIKEYENFSRRIEGIRVDGIAGCVLTYMYIHKCAEEKVPMFTRLIGDRDIWKFEYGDETRGFCMALTVEDTRPESEFWLDLSKPNNDNWHKLIGKGLGMIKTNDIMNAKFIKSWGYETTIYEFEQYKCFAVNKPQGGSEMFKSVFDKNYDIYISIGFDGIQWVVSLYSTKVDVSVIAKHFGGGGHKGAAGFVSKVPPFRKI